MQLSEFWVIDWKIQAKIACSTTDRAIWFSG
jgi:hypothetical protein